ncbi:MAG: autotransporter outer membrane beta-barrel domain-containing protein [Pirellulales bacterium]
MPKRGRSNSLRSSNAFRRPARRAHNSAPIVNTAAPNGSRRSTTEHYGWVGGYGQGGDATGDGNAQGFNYGFGGTSFGIDRRIDSDLVVGMAGGYAGSHVRTDTGLQSAKVDSLQSGLYFSKSFGRGYFFGVGSYGHDMYDTTRLLPANITARGEYSGNQFSTYFERGTTRSFGRWNLQPFANLQYILLQQDGFTETGAGGAGLTVGSTVNNSLRPGMGLRLARPMIVGGVMVVPDLHARYAYEMLDVDRLVTANFSGAVGGSFLAGGNQLGRHFGQYGVGLNAAFTRRFGGYLGYDAVTADRTVSHTGSGGLQLAW